MRLYLDRGNSALKWALEAPGQAPLYGRGSLDLLKQQLSAQKIDACYLANVAGESFEEELSAGLDLPVESLHRARVEQGFARLQLAYSDVSKLGVDRWLSLLACWHERVAPALVLSLGTAVTVDKLDAGGRHVGGLIAPGWPLLSASLQRGTANIAHVPQVFNGSSELGRDTAACVNAGVSQMCKSFVQSVLEDFAEADCTIIVCGGGAQALAEVLPERAKLRTTLVLDGLSYWRLLKGF
ncbi:type III pantothenate kinase [Agaribacterium haliotis]|uniref:type III pantothenate kinase n=1 Tax=Agaribacterium haliotis TaxID=2013869 RepID=UPI000BB59309|nr:type III pantothenate kinase [Agaribacterium haliotis]